MNHKESKKLNVLRLCDQFGWAYSFLAMEQAKYSRHNITCKRLQDMTVADIKGIDVLYIPGPNMGYASIRDQMVEQARRQKCAVVCGYAGEHELMYPDADIIVSISAKFYPRLKELYALRKVPIVFLPESADTEFFTPATVPETFTVGWSGRVAEVKRCHLLDQLSFPVKRQSDHGKEFFKEPNRSLQPMKEFYQSLSALVLTSSSEAMPRVVLEAMSCGLPVVTTDVGSLRMIMDSMWIVPVNPESVVVRDVSNRLNLLSKYPELAKDVGVRNRKFIEDHFSWKVNQPIWDLFFDNVAKNHWKSVEIYNAPYRKKYGELEPALLK